MDSGGMGFEGLIYYDFSEMENGNPWHEGMELTTLPVFRNNSYSTAGIPHGLTREEMEVRIQAAAQVLGLEVTGLKEDKEQRLSPGTWTMRRRGGDRGGGQRHRHRRL